MQIQRRLSVALMAAAVAIPATPAVPLVVAFTGAVAAIVVVAEPASADMTFTVQGTWRVREHANTGARQTATVSNGQRVSIRCQVVGQRVTVDGFGSSSIWDYLPGLGFMPDLGIRETAYDRRDSRLPDCGGSTATPRRWGQTRGHNSGVSGHCTWYAYDRFKQATGAYPALTGDAHNWNDSARATGWTVVLDAEPRSIVVFERGTQGADRNYGHVGWVENVEFRADGRWITFVEMNYTGRGQVSRRTVKDVGGMSYILAP